MTGDLIMLDALGPDGGYRTRNQFSVTDVTGARVAVLSLVPRLFVHRTIAALRRASSLPVRQREQALAAAGDRFVHGTPGGMSFEEYARQVSRVCGVPISVVRSAAGDIADAARRAHLGVTRARPAGAVEDWRDPATSEGRAVWTRRGDVFAVHAAGNHPSPHALWLEALQLGYRVAVRPSRRDPFTPHRLVAALREAGFGNDQVALLPTDHDGAEEMMRQADLGIAYGGDDVVRRYAPDPTVSVQGPGRSKILVTADVDWRDHLDTIVSSITHHAGVACINASAVFVEGDPGPLAQALAGRLGGLPSLPPEDDRAVLPVQPVESARAIEGYLRIQAKGATAVLGEESIVDDLGDGSAVLRPAVYQLAAAEVDRAGIELPLPCVWVAPWEAASGTAPLRDTLVLTALTGREPLVDALLAEPTISNVYVGDRPTWWLEPGVPHDGYLAEFLMRTKTVIRG